MKFAKEEAQLKVASDALQAKIVGSLPVGCRVSVPHGRGRAHGVVAGYSGFSFDPYILIRYDSSRQIHRKHFHEIEKA